ncbi:apolipoprotein M isoform X1 [Pelobates fuscus]|uniref:apolipoprotein M isoform X1 n=1 Tax=Pelobates fuscus TaxID=191477 RepID=UPI002FE45E39
MIGNTWSYILYLYGLVIDSLIVCDNSDRLSASSVNRTEFPLQYMGQWYFLAAAAPSESGALETFKVMDNAEFRVQASTEQEKLVFIATVRVKDGSCVPRKWIYLLTDGSTELRTEGHPDRTTELFSSKCSKCVILKETENDISRLLLYSRSPQLEEEFIEEFKEKASCEGYKEILEIPQTLDYCHMEK